MAGPPADEVAVAIAQIAPVWLDRAASPDKVAGYETSCSPIRRTSSPTG